MDDGPTWTRLWRCSRCGTLWLEGTPIPRAVGADEADAAAPRWRDADAWITETSLRDLLRMYSGGSIDGEAFARAALHHDVLADDVDLMDPRPLALYSGADEAEADGQLPSSVSWGSVASRLRWTSGRRQVVIDRSSPWRCDLDADVIEYLDANGRRTETESDRRRDDARRTQ